jgi:uncharacterized protein with PQ loop repeat
MSIADWICTISSILLAVCGVPQAWKSYRTKSADDVSWFFLLMWFVGEFGLLWFAIKTGLHPMMILNYVVNLVVVMIISWFKGHESSETR